MNKPYILTPQQTRAVTFFQKDSKDIPCGLFESEAVAPDLNDFPYPLPSKKSDYTCWVKSGDGAFWYGASTGLTRYMPTADRKDDIVMFFSAPRDMEDNNVKALFAVDDEVWVETDMAVVRIRMPFISMEEKADILLNETLKYVDRRGMVSQRELHIPRIAESRFNYAHSDNDGGFTAGFVMGELFKYAVLKREKGDNDEQTQAALKIATRACEACLLLMNITGRGDGFIARTYVTTGEVVPDDGLFYRKKDGKATCLETTASKRRGLVGKVIDASSPVPDRLARLYREEGYSDDDIIFKGDTSSDEISLHFFTMMLAHDILGEVDSELDELIVSSIKATMKHIIDNGYELHEFEGKPTLWAKWSPEYFNTGMGWADAPLNAAELLMYLKVTMHVSGEKGVWEENYNKLINEMGYADLAMRHEDRFWHMAVAARQDICEDIMYGDHALATVAYGGLLMLETDEVLRKKYATGFKSWRSSMAREHNPYYDFIYKLSCPDEEIDMERIATWLYRTNTSRLAAGVSLSGRHDIVCKRRMGGYNETGSLLPPDERYIAKHDRNPYQFVNEQSGGTKCLESCYVYTGSYWMGRYYGFIK